MTDPPYDEMIAYADASDLFYVWLKRCLHSHVGPNWPITADPHGTQEKTDEIIVKRVRGEAPDEHRTREHYDTLIAEAFAEMRRVVRDDGVVTIVFGHGEPEVWQRLLHCHRPGRPRHDRLLARQHRVRRPAGQSQHRDHPHDGLPARARRIDPPAARAPSKPRSRPRSSSATPTGNAGDSRPPTC